MKVWTSSPRGCHHSPQVNDCNDPQPVNSALCRPAIVSRTVKTEPPPPGLRMRLFSAGRSHCGRLGLDDTPQGPPLVKKVARRKKLGLAYSVRRFVIGLRESSLKFFNLLHIIVSYKYSVSEILLRFVRSTASLCFIVLQTTLSCFGRSFDSASRRCILLQPLSI